MNETYTRIEKFLDEFFQKAELNLKAELQPHAEGCVVNLVGDDVGLLLFEGGEVLDAFQHILYQGFGREMPQGERVTCDADGYRATRAAELRAMARHAAQHVRDSGVPFIFGPMSSDERRAIHMNLAEEPDLQTESTGMGAQRRLQIKLKR